MKKTFTNGTIFIMGNILLGTNGQPGLIAKKYLNSVAEVRHALKFNNVAILEKHKIIGEMFSDINKEMCESYLSEGKATETDGTITINKEFEREFIIEQNNKLGEISEQSVELDIVTIPKEKFELYESINEGKLTEGELDILELFIEEKETTE